MTAINEILAPCYTDPSANFGGNDLMRRNYERYELSKKVNQYLTDAANTHQGWALFLGMCKMNAKCAPDYPRPIHPDEIKAVCAALNVTTLEQLSAWIEMNGGVNAAALLNSIYDRPVVLPPLQAISFGEAATRILAATNLVFDPEIFSGHSEITDVQYELHTEQSAAMLVNDFPFWNYSFIPEKRDCDDFTRILRGRTSQAGRGNGTAFGADIVATDAQGGRLNSAHSLVLVLTDQGVWLWETQNGTAHLDKRYYPSSMYSDIGGGVAPAGNVVMKLAM